jgi:hypothetical protein
VIGVLVATVAAEVSVSGEPAAIATADSALAVSRVRAAGREQSGCRKANTSQCEVADRATTLEVGSVFLRLLGFVTVSRRLAVFVPGVAHCLIPPNGL